MILQPITIKGGNCMHAGVRKQFKGQIVEIKKGRVMSEVVVKAGNNNITLSIPQ